MRFAGYVQAGGGSTRFGRDKALVEFGGRTLLARTMELAGSVCDEVKIVAAGEEYRNLGAPVIRDEWPGQGPLGGIITALRDANRAAALPRPGDSPNRERAQEQWTLIVSCDMPFLTGEWLAFLRERALQSTAQIVVPESAGGLEPLCACWRSDTLVRVEAAFAEGVRKVSEAMARVKMEVLDEASWKRFDSDNRLFWNMNTPEDYEEARRIFARRADPSAPAKRAGREDPTCGSG